MIDLPAGESVATKGDIVVLNPGRHLAKTAIHGQWVLLDCEIDPSVKRMTIFDGILLKTHGRYGVSTTIRTNLFVHTPMEMTGVFTM